MEGELTEPDKAAAEDRAVHGAEHPAARPSDDGVKAELEYAFREDNFAVHALRSLLAPLDGAARFTGSVASGAAILLAAFGVVIAGTHYSRAGVPLGDLPILLVTGAGLGFVLLTGLGVYVGIVVGLGPSLRRRLVLLGLATLIVVGQLGVRMAASVWFLLYFAIPMGFGHGLGRAMQPALPAALEAAQKPAKQKEQARAAGQLERSALFGKLQSAIWPLLLAGLYGGLVYPLVPAEWGGGRPKRVQIVWHAKPEGLPAGMTYEVFRDSGLLYLAVDQAPVETGFGSRLLYSFSSPTISYVAVPVGAVRSITYLPWVSYDQNEKQTGALNSVDAGPKDADVADRQRELPEEAPGPESQETESDPGLANLPDTN